MLGYFDPGLLPRRPDGPGPGRRRRRHPTLADNFGVSVHETAWGILSLASEAMVKAVHEITISQGLEPSDSTLVAGEARGRDQHHEDRRRTRQRAAWCCPKVASALSASGMHFADIVEEESKAFITSSDNFAADGVDAVLDALELRLESFAQRFGGDNADYTVDFGVESPLQVAGVGHRCPAHPRGASRHEGVRDKLFEVFHDLHERIFAVRDPESAIEFLNWRARVTVKLPADTASIRAARPAPEHPDIHRRRCYFGDTGVVNTLCSSQSTCRRGPRSPGRRSSKPTTTRGRLPCMSATVADSGNYLLSIGT